MHSLFHIELQAFPGISRSDEQPLQTEHEIQTSLRKQLATSTAMVPRPPLSGHTPLVAINSSRDADSRSMTLLHVLFPNADHLDIYDRRPCSPCATLRAARIAGRRRKTTVLVADGSSRQSVSTRRFVVLAALPSLTCRQHGSLTVWTK